MDKRKKARHVKTFLICKGLQTKDFTANGAMEQGELPKAAARLAFPKNANFGQFATVQAALESAKKPNPASMDRHDHELSAESLWTRFAGLSSDSASRLESTAVGPWLGGWPLVPPDTHRGCRGIGFGAIM